MHQTVQESIDPPAQAEAVRDTFELTQEPPRERRLTDAEGTSTSTRVKRKKPKQPKYGRFVLLAELHSTRTWMTR
jgi:hypothetical protein